MAHPRRAGDASSSTWNDKSHVVAILDTDAIVGERHIGHDKEHCDRHSDRDSKRDDDHLPVYGVQILSLRFGAGSVVIPAYRNAESITLVTKDSTGTITPTRLSLSTPRSSYDLDNAATEALAQAF